MKTKADIMTEISLYVRLNYQDDWYLQEKINQLKERIYEKQVVKSPWDLAYEEYQRSYTAEQI